MKNKTFYLPKEDWLKLEKSLQNAIQIANKGKLLTQRQRKEWTKDGALTAITFRGDVFIAKPKEVHNG